MFCTEEDSGEHSPGIGRRGGNRTRPLSMVLEENHDKDDDDDDDDKNKNNTDVSREINAGETASTATTTATAIITSTTITTTLAATTAEKLSSAANSLSQTLPLVNGHAYNVNDLHMENDDEVNQKGNEYNRIPLKRTRREGVWFQESPTTPLASSTTTTAAATTTTTATNNKGDNGGRVPLHSTNFVSPTSPTTNRRYTSPPSPQQRRLFLSTPPRQRKLSDNTLWLRGRKVSDTGESTDSETEGDTGSMAKLKDTATKLNLPTRRPSFSMWHDKYVQKQPRDFTPLTSPTEEVKVSLPEVKDGRLTQERKERMDKDLKWIREQLVDMRRQDRSLARQLLGIRKELSSLRLAVSCEEHRKLLEDAQDEMEDFRELSRFVDLPLDMFSLSPLRHLGVTKMNLSSRRFSTC